MGGKGREKVCDILLGALAAGAFCPSLVGTSCGESGADVPVASVFSLCSGSWLHPGSGRLRICEARVPIISSLFSGFILRCGMEKAGENPLGQMGCLQGKMDTKF